MIVAAAAKNNNKTKKTPQARISKYGVNACYTNGHCPVKMKFGETAYKSFTQCKQKHTDPARFSSSSTGLDMRPVAKQSTALSQAGM